MQTARMSLNLAVSCLSHGMVLHHESSPESSKSYWVICNFSDHMTLNHTLIQAIICSKFPRTSIRRPQGMNFPPLAVDKEATCGRSLFTSLSSEEPTVVNRKTVASIRAACVYLPAFFSPPFSSPLKLMHERESGRQVSSLNPNECSLAEGRWGEAEAFTWALTHRDELGSCGRFVHSAASLGKICA